MYKIDLKIPAFIKRISPLMVVMLLTVMTINVSGQQKNKLFREGNRLYNNGKFGEAEMSYRKGLELDKEDVKGRYNLGDALYQEKKFEESTRLFEGLTESKNIDTKTKAKAYHNLGNSLLESKQYEKSIDAFKHSLINDPADKDTKYNLEYAKLMLKKQQQQQQQQQKKDQQKKEDKKDQQDQKDQQQQQEKKDQQDPKKISKEDAERMLEALKNDEKRTMQKVKKEKVKSKDQTIIEKDW